VAEPKAAEFGMHSDLCAELCGPEHARLVVGCTSFLYLSERFLSAIGSLGSSVAMHTFENVAVHACVTLLNHIFLSYCRVLWLAENAYARSLRAFRMSGRLGSAAVPD
jgi:hypothetical protein